ncbi:MAG: glycosyltransferase family 2 protein, partial [Weeksellaceae bacterium]
MTLAEFKSKYEKVPVDEFPNEVPDDVKVSVCVQTYQHAPYIEECLNSILAQETDFNYEILLGEDASTDGTRDICIRYAKEHPTKIRLFLHHRENNILINGNPSGRFNLLYNFNSAKGKYIAICEGDDYWTDSLKLQKQVDFLEKNPSCKLSITNSKYFYQEQGIFKPFTIPKKYINKSSNVVDPMYTFSKKGVVFSMASFMFRKNEIFDILFKELQSVMNFSDRAIQLRALKDGSICCLPDVTSAYRV